VKELGGADKRVEVVEAFEMRSHLDEKLVGEPQERGLAADAVCRTHSSNTKEEEEEEEEEEEPSPQRLGGAFDYHAGFREPIVRVKAKSVAIMWRAHGGIYLLS
jgi:hypothetical protein